MAYKIRVILDVDQDVFRDIVVNEAINLEELHFIIAKSFGFKGQEMASFYLTDATWEQGEEIPLFDMSEDENSFCMANCVTSMVLKKESDKLIYIYDFFSMWTFFVELTEIIDEADKELPFIALSFGNPPEKAPEKDFIGEDIDADNFDAFDDEANFDNIDDIDLDNY
ncbi:plasmid pRiA4b ORF-3 family protein [Lutibacter sp. A64]|uniref:plasmid pRiA4b ORF-3 family protein n=1 Tax=Lutibacter sp. A64 TaxID=2918526 RepID=UPI001F06A5DC|nr:plasmid pRiA4b ORF-3 family protein [Lutibacter sp. A64]UMB54841.1 plasmid pRiA4b ORF-3 family protein [Lutibacter sp. A64]